jgi:hypothetical protein
VQGLDDGSVIQKRRGAVEEGWGEERKERKERKVKKKELQRLINHSVREPYTCRDP